MKSTHLLVFKETKTSPLLNPEGTQARWNIYTKSYLTDRQQKGTRPRNFLDNVFNRKGADLLKKFGIEFDYSKPIELITFLLDIINPCPGDIVLDFFAGSGSTAHAVLESNKKGSVLQFVLVQLPEPLSDQERGSNPGCSTVADICKERVRRVINKLDEEQAGKLDLAVDKKPDLGFRVFKLAESNFTPWDAQAPKDANGLLHQLELHVDHVRESRTADDILYELLLKSGFPLTTPVERKTLASKTVYSVAGWCLGDLP